MKKPLDRFLTLFADVRAGEGASALLLMLNVFLLLTAYYLIKPAREALILASSGAEVKSYAAAGQALILLVAVPLYGALAARFPRRGLINVVTLFFVGCLLLFYVAARAGLAVGVPFYLWVGVFNLMIIAQFWAFANDVYTPDQGKRLFAIIGFGASSGAVLGGVIAKQLITPFGVEQLLVVSAGVLLLAAVITNCIDLRAQRAAPSNAASSAAAPKAKRTSGSSNAAAAPIHNHGAFRLLMRNRYLLQIAFLLLILNWVNTTGEYLLGEIVTDKAKAAVASGAAQGLNVGDYIGIFYSDFFSVVNLVSLLTQAFLVSRILRFLGVRAALLILPVIAFGGYLLLAFYPVLGIVRWAKTAENSTDYSLQNTVRNVLFLPTTREEKYVAKQAIDSVFVRAGDVLSASLVFVGTHWLALNTRDFALLNLVLVSVWILLAIQIGRRFLQLERLFGGATSSGVAIPPDPSMNEMDSMTNASANVLGYENNKWIEWLQQGDRIIGIWVKALPGNTRKRDFLATICAMRKNDDARMRILSGAYTIEKASRGEGFDIRFK
jgi:AAA family ATP:ADP antiporter